MSIIIEFKSTVCSYPPICTLQRPLQTQIYQMLNQMRYLAINNFPFAAVSQISLLQSCSVQQLEQINALVKQQTGQFITKVSKLTYSYCLPFALISAFAKYFLQPSCVQLSYLIQQIFCEVLLDSARVQELLKDVKVNISTQLLLHLTLLANFDPKKHLTLEFQLQPPLKVLFIIQLDEYVQVLEIIEKLINECSGYLRPITVLQWQDSFKSQIWCNNISPRILSSVMHFNSITHTILSNHCIFENSKPISSEGPIISHEKQLNSSVPSLIGKSSLLKSQYCRQIFTDTSYQLPIVVGIDDSYSKLTEPLICLNITLSSKFYYQIFQCCRNTSPLELICFFSTVKNTYRCYVLKNPELLPEDCIYYLQTCYPLRFIDNIRFKSDSFQNNNSVQNFLPESHGIPIKGQLVILTRFLKIGQNHCCCRCQNIFCQKQNPEDKIMDCEQPIINHEYSVVYQFINNSLFYDLSCCLGNCRHITDSLSLEKSIHSINVLNEKCSCQIQKYIEFNIKFNKISVQQPNQLIYLNEYSIQNIDLLEKPISVVDDFYIVIIQLYHQMQYYKYILQPITISEILFNSNVSYQFDLQSFKNLITQFINTQLNSYSLQELKLLLNQFTFQKDIVSLIDFPKQFDYFLNYLLICSRQYSDYLCFLINDGNKKKIDQYLLMLHNYLETSNQVNLFDELKNLKLFQQFCNNQLSSPYFILGNKNQRDLDLLIDGKVCNTNYITVFISNIMENRYCFDSIADPLSSLESKLINGYFSDTNLIQTTFSAIQITRFQLFSSRFYKKYWTLLQIIILHIVKCQKSIAETIILDQNFQPSLQYSTLSQLVMYFTHYYSLLFQTDLFPSDVIFYLKDTCLFITGQLLLQQHKVVVGQIFICPNYLSILVHATALKDRVLSQYDSFQKQYQSSSVFQFFDYIKTILQEEVVTQFILQNFDKKQNTSSQYYFSQICSFRGDIVCFQQVKMNNQQLIQYFYEIIQIQFSFREQFNSTTFEQTISTLLSFEVDMDMVEKLLRHYCTFVDLYFVGNNRKIDYKILTQSLFSGFNNILKNLFDNNNESTNQQEFTIINSLILTNLMNTTDYESIMLFNGLQKQELMLLPFSQYCSYIVGVILCHQCEIDIFIQNISDYDFLQQTFQQQHWNNNVGFIRIMSSCCVTSQHIQDSDPYYNDIFSLRRQNVNNKRLIVLIHNNCKLCNKCLKCIYKQQKCCILSSLDTQRLKIFFNISKLFQCNINQLFIFLKHYFNYLDLFQSIAFFENVCQQNIDVMKLLQQLQYISLKTQKQIPILDQHHVLKQCQINDLLIESRSLGCLVLPDYLVFSLYQKFNKTQVDLDLSQIQSFKYALDTSNQNNFLLVNQINFLQNNHIHIPQPKNAFKIMMDLIYNNQPSFDFKTVFEMLTKIKIMDIKIQSIQEKYNIQISNKLNVFIFSEENFSIKNKIINEFAHLLGSQTQISMDICSNIHGLQYQQNMVVIHTNWNSILTIINYLHSFNYKAIIVVFLDDIQNIQKQLFFNNFLTQCSLYKVSLNDYKFIFEKEEQLNVIDQWLSFETQLWNIASIQNATFFSQNKHSISQDRLTQESKTLILAKIFNQNFSLLTHISQLFLKYFLSFIQNIDLLIDSDINLWRQSYSFAKYSQITDKQNMLAIFAQHDNIQQIIDIFHHNSKLNLTLFKIIVPIVNSFKPLINGLSCDPHPLISAYYLGNKNQMPVPFNLSLLETSKVPQLFPISRHAMIFSILLSETNEQFTITNNYNLALNHSLNSHQTSIDTLDNFDLFVFLLLLTSRLYEAEALFLWFLNVKTPKIDIQRLQQFSTFLKHKLLQYFNQTNDCSIISNCKYLKIVLENTALATTFSHLIHFSYKSDIVNFIMADNTTFQQYSKFIVALFSNIAAQCFASNLNSNVLLVRYLLMSMTADNYQYWLLLQYYYSAFIINEHTTFDLVLSSFKDFKNINYYRQKTQNNNNDYIIEILCDKQVIFDQFLSTQLFKHFATVGSFSQNLNICKQQLSLLLSGKYYNHLIVIQKYFEQCENIFDTTQFLSTSYLSVININTLDVFRALCIQFSIMIQKQTYDGILLQQLLLLQQVLPKCQYNYLDLQQNNESQVINEQYMLKFYQSFIINIISVIIVQFLIDGQNYDLITNCISEIIQIPNIQNIILDTLTKKLGVEIAFTFIYNNQYISENLPEIHQKAKLYMVNNVIEELPKWVVAPFLNDKLYYQTKDPTIMQMLTASQSVQSFLVNESQLDFDYRPLYDFNVLKIENHISRCKVLKQKQFDTITQSILVSTEAFLIEINGKCFHSLLADNHDDTLGLWMPGHAFESRLGIVHADCGLKDTRFDKVDPKDVHIRQLNSVATRVCWILTFSSILFSLYINPITFETSSERSILSDANLLTQSRDEYCISVIQTSLSVLSQIEGTYLYEIVILYQQFLKIYNRELRKTKSQDLIFPRTAVMRDRIEEIIQKSATEASIAYKAIVQNNTKFSNQKELNSFDQVQDKEKEENQVLQLLKMSYHPKQITAVINAAAHGSVILKFVSCVKKQLNPVLSFNDNCVLFPALESVKTNFQRFLFFYEQCSEMLTIGGGCQDNKLPLLSDDVIIQQLFTFDNSETMQFAVIEEFIIAADNFIQSQQLPANPFLQGGTQVIEVQPQAFLL